MQSSFTKLEGYQPMAHRRGFLHLNASESNHEYFRKDKSVGIRETPSAAETDFGLHHFNTNRFA